MHLGGSWLALGAASSARRNRGSGGAAAALGSAAMSVPLGNNGGGVGA